MGKKFDEVCSLNNLIMAFRKGYKKGSRPGSNGISWRDIGQENMDFIVELQRELLLNEFVPSVPTIETKTYLCGSSEKRITYVLVNVRERIVEYAIKEVLNSLYEEVFLPFSCAYRKNKDEKYFRELINNILSEGILYFVSTDIRSFYGSIDRKILMGEIFDFTNDEKLVKLIKRCIFFDEGEAGIMPGHVLAPLLSNIFLHPIDVELKDMRVVRYADNYIFPQNDNLKWTEKVELISILLKKRNLELNKEKTKLLINPDPESILFD